MSKTNEPKKVCVGAYLRVSSARQASEGDSLEAQRNIVNAYVTQKEAVGEWSDTDVRFFIEPGRSGKDDKRPEFQKLRRAVLDNNIDVVICVKFDRVSRNVIDLLQFRNFLGEHEVEFVSIRESFDTTTTYGKFALNLLASVAEMERDLISERTRTVMHDRAERGLWNTRPPYGYRQADNDKGKLVPDEEWAAIIKEQFFDGVELHKSAGALATHLREIGLTTPKRKTKTGKTIGGRIFDARQVKNVLTNRAYLGEVNWGGVRTLNAHEPLVSQEQFDRVQKILHHAMVGNNTPEKATDRIYLLAQLVRCGKCGSTMTPYSTHGRGGKRFHYYACTTRQHKGMEACSAAYVPAPAIEEAIVQRCIELSCDEKARDKIVDNAFKQADTDRLRLDKEIEIARGREGEIKKEINNLISVLRSLGEDGLDSVREDLKRLEEDRGAIQKQIESLQAQQEELQPINDLQRRFIESWRGLGDLLKVAGPAARRKLLLHMIEVIEWKTSEESKRCGTYAIRFFPEAVEDRADLWAMEWYSDGPENEQGPTEVDPLLRSSALVRTGYTLTPSAQPAKRCDRSIIDMQFY
jgi:DNA invertase Pin-like site-specific DNA recombinase